MPTNTRPSLVIIFACFYSRDYRGWVAVVVIWIFYFQSIREYMIYEQALMVLIKHGHMSIINNTTYNMQKQQTIKIPKPKKRQILSKLLLDPSQLGTGIPSSPLPELTDKGLILALTKPAKLPLAKLTSDGSLKMQIVYTSESIQLLGHYVEVEVIDDYGDFWMGELFGCVVRGTGGQGTGNLRGCKVNSIEGQTIVVSWIGKGGNQKWKKMKARIDQMINKK